MDDLPYVITVVRTGGFAGLRAEWTVEVSVPREAEQWRPIIEACPWDASDHASARRDGYVYDVRVADHEAVVPEQDLEGPWRELVDEVRRRAG